MRKDAHSFLPSSLLYFFKLKQVENLISLGSPRAYKYDGIGKFIDDLSAINDG